MQPEGTPVPQQTGGSNPTPLAPGQLVGGGRYELQRILDKGGMSSVWLAEDSRLHEKVALKFLPPEIVNDPAAFREMQKETTKSRKFSHPNIIRIYDLHESSDEVPFISMEFIEGENLHNLSGQQPHGFFTWEQLKPWVRQLCDALTYAHGEGVIHRDLKPANMMVDTKGRLKLADFGISMTVDESKRRGNSNPINGTLGYMSPQQLSGHPAHVTDDIHAMGATLYELLTGRRPFHSGDIYAQVISTKPKPLNETLWEQGLTNDIPPDVSSLIMACLAKDPSMRPASAKVVAEWLDLKSGEASGNQFVAQAVGDGLAGHPDSETIPGRTSGSLLRKVITRLVAYLVILCVIVTAILISRAKLEEIAIGESPEITTKTQPSGPPSVMAIKTVPTNAAATAVAATLKKPGSIDHRFAPQGWPNKIVFAAVDQLNNKYVIGGDFTKVGTNDCSRIARFNSDGSLDTSFNHPGGINEEIGTMLRLPDGKLLIGGHFVEVYGVNVGRLARLNSDGSLDRSFSVKVPDSYINCIVAQPDGKILISGKFSRVEPSKITRNGITRLNSDGSVDETFNIGQGANDAVDRMLLQPDGKIILAGKFTMFQDRPCSRIVRLTPAGLVDGTFAPGSGFDADVMALELEPNGNILAGGHFTRYNGRAANSIVRLGPDGSIRGSFGFGANAFVGVIKMAGPDRIWVGGNFTLFNRAPFPRLVLITLNGEVAPEFMPALGTDGSVRTLTHIPGERLLVGGNFNSFAGQPKPHLVMLHAGKSTATNRTSTIFTPGFSPPRK